MLLISLSIIGLFLPLSLLFRVNSLKLLSKSTTRALKKVFDPCILYLGVNLDDYFGQVTQGQVLLYPTF